MAPARSEGAGGRARDDGAGSAGRARAGAGADGAASSGVGADGAASSGVAAGARRTASSGVGADAAFSGAAAGAGRTSPRASTARRDPGLRAARYRLDRDAATDDARAMTATGADAGAGAGPGADAGAERAQGAEPERLPTVDELRTIARIRLDQAIARGEFDDLPGAGKPLPGLTGTHDPDWWIKGLIERENLSGLAPPALSLRTEHERFDAALDALTTERAVREAVDDFNARVVEARRQLTGGPPVITPTRDLDDDLRRWRERREKRRRVAAAAVPPPLTWRERRRAAREERARRRARRRAR